MGVLQMKCSDWIMQFLVKQGVRHVFVLPGGLAMYLVDSLGSNKELTYVPMLHEQAAGFAAEGYSGFAGLGVCLVTSGPGGTNAISAVASAWVNSSPVLFISGQVAKQDLKSEDQRFNGVQEIDIISIVQPITKYARRLMDADNAMQTFGLAVHEAISQRNGPVWLDIPLDVQAQETTCEIKQVMPYSYHNPFDVEMVLDAIDNAKRKVVLLGHGATAHRDKTIAFLNKYRALHPLVTWRAIDLLDCPRPGVLSSPEANKELQACDLLLVLGARLDSETVGYSYANFAPKAVKICVDIDLAELQKLPDDWIKINTGCGYFVEQLL
jgi:acetolactate synthase-1/2/3 large subunit